MASNAIFTYQNQETNLTQIKKLKNSPKMEFQDYNPSKKSLLKNKWISTTASIWIQSTSGSLYTFSIYSQLLKSTQNYDQSTLNTISVFKDFGANVGTLSGLLYTSCGPQLVFLVGSLQCFFGYFMMWLTVTGKVPRPKAGVMCVYMVFAAHAMTFFNTGNVVTGVVNFPNYGGTVVGIMKGFLGLSGAILIQVYQTIFKNKPASYLLLLSLLPTIVPLLLMGFVRSYRTNEEGEKKHLNGFSFTAVILAAYLTAIIIMRTFLELKLVIRVIIFAVLVLLLVSPIFVAIQAQRDKSYRIIKSLLEHNQVSYENEENTHDGENRGEYHEISNGADQAIETNGNTLQWRGDSNLLGAMGTLSFWCLFLTTLCAMGSGLATVNNMSQIGESLGYTTLETNTLVSLWSIWNFLGRFGAGYISDYFLNVKGCPRPLFIVFTLAAMSIGHVMIAFGFPGALYAGSVLIGVCYGSQWSLMPTIVSDIFGKTHLGTIFNTVTIAGPIGSYLLSVQVIGYIYDKETSGHGEACIGTQCFFFSFIVMAAVTFSGFLVALVLFFRTRSFYKNVVFQKLLYSLIRTGVVIEDTE